MEKKFENKRRETKKYLDDMKFFRALDKIIDARIFVILI